MPSFEQFQRGVQVFDDDALVALANKGLLRRAKKDLEKETPELIGEQDGGLCFSVGDVEVMLRNPLQKSSCSSLPNGISRATLAVILWLRDHQVEEAPSLSLASSTPVDIVPEILALRDDELQRWAGKPMLRKAVETLTKGVTVELGEGGKLLIAEFSQTVTWIPGQGLEGMICTCHAEECCLHKLIAVVGIQASKGQRELSNDPRILDASSGAPRTREEILKATRSLLREIVNLGISRASLTVMQRLQTLSVSAHGVDLPNLERQLSGIADEVRLMVQRSASASPQSLCSRMARAYVLCKALQNGTTGLVGEHRSQYIDVGRLLVHGYAARVWRTRSGYRGLTVYFWNPLIEAWMSWSDSRPESLAGYDPRQRFLEEGPWEGIHSPLEAAAKRIQLTGAWRNGSGRISGRPATRGLALGDSLDAPDGPPCLRDWSSLGPVIQEHFGGGLRARAELGNVVYLEPAEWGTGTFDSIQQRFELPMIDDRGKALSLVLKHEAEGYSGVDALEGIDFQPGDRVVGSLYLHGDRCVVEPITVWHQGVPQHLTLSKPKEAKESSKLNSESERGRASVSQTLELLNALLSLLQGYAEGGAGTPVGDLPHLIKKLKECGLTLCADQASILQDELVALQKTRHPDRDKFAAGLLNTWYLASLAREQVAVVISAKALS